MSILKDVETREFIYGLYTIFNKNIYDITKVKLENIYMCTNIKQDVKDFGSVPNGNYNGLTLYYDINNLIILVEHKDEYNDIITLVHEFIHAYDFLKFYEKFNELDNNSLFQTYYQWSEFHAYYLSEEFLIRFYKKNGIQSNIIDCFLDTHNEYLLELIEELNQKRANNEFTFDEMMLLLAKIYLYDIFDEINDLNNSHLYEYIDLFFSQKDVKQVIAIYNTCIRTCKYNSIFNKLEYLDKLFKGGPYMEIIECSIYGGDCKEYDCPYFDGDDCTYEEESGE